MLLAEQAQGVALMFLAFPQSWAGLTAMARRNMSLRAGTGGAVLRMMVRIGTTCVTMVVAYLPATTAATMGSTSAVLVRKRMYQT